MRIVRPALLALLGSFLTAATVLAPVSPAAQAAPAGTNGPITCCPM